MILVDAILRWVKAKGGKSVTGEVADGNLPSIALLRKFGFAEDRKTRYKKWGEETYFDAHYYKLNLDSAADSVTVPTLPLSGTKASFPWRGTAFAE